MARSCRPSVSHLRAMDEDSCGHSSSCVATQASTSCWSLNCSRNRCLVSRTSSSVEPLIAERGCRRSVGSSTRVQFSHWSPRALSYPQCGQVPSTYRSGRKRPSTGEYTWRIARSSMKPFLWSWRAKCCVISTFCCEELRPKIVKGQLEAVVDGLLRVMRLRAELSDRQSLLLGRQLGRSAVLIGGADVEDIATALAEVPGVHIRWQHRPDHVAQVLDPVDVGKRAGDQVTSHPWMLHFVHTAPRTLPSAG